jgi:hypothetical protein
MSAFQIDERHCISFQCAGSQTTTEYRPTELGELPEAGDVMSDHRAAKVMYISPVRKARAWSATQLSCSLPRRRASRRDRGCCPGRESGEIAGAENRRAPPLSLGSWWAQVLLPRTAADGIANRAGERSPSPKGSARRTNLACRSQPARVLRSRVRAQAGVVDGVAYYFFFPRAWETRCGRRRISGSAELKWR